MSAVIKETTQKKLYRQLLQLLEDKLKKLDIDYFMMSDCSKKAPKDWEVLEVVFKPKGTNGQAGRAYMLRQGATRLN